MQRILVFDPASCTGYAVIDIYETFSEIVTYGTFEMDKDVGKEGDWYLNIEKQAKQLIQQYHPHQIGIEDYFMSSSNKMGGCNLNVGIRAIFQALTRRENLPYIVINISSWKKVIAGRTRPCSSQIEKWGKVAANKYFIQQALFEKFQIQFPYMIKSELTNRWIAFKSDPVDAVAMAIYLSLEKNVSQIHNLVSFENIKPSLKLKFDYMDLPCSIQEKQPKKVKKNIK